LRRRRLRFRQDDHHDDLDDDIRRGDHDHHAVAYGDPFGAGSARASPRRRRHDGRRADDPVPARDSVAAADPLATANPVAAADPGGRVISRRKDANGPDTP
jgi:hypothetical protein